jgi:hypothetical protein
MEWWGCFFSLEGSRSVKISTPTSLAVAESTKVFMLGGKIGDGGMFFYKSAESALSAQQLIAEISQDLVSRPHKGRLLVRTIGIQP